MARIRISYRAEYLEKCLEARIRQGVYKVGAPLPPERQLGEELGAARNTVRKALQTLHHRGLLDFRGRTYRVSERPSEIYFPLKEDPGKAYAIFFSAGKPEDELLCSLEKRLREEGCLPVTFNLDSLSGKEGQIDFIEYLHLKVEGVFFLANRLANLRQPLSAQMLAMLPLPYVLIGCDSLEGDARCVQATPEKLVKALFLHIAEQKWNEVEIAFSWPLSKRTAELLRLISLEISPPGTESLHSLHFEELYSPG
ncbi:MAG: GntR family transcriptional regulator, partial [Planctomycetes bacterium]|nr:GntR family transcriptional regulator [Planctomycetota bacterium]